MWNPYVLHLAAASMQRHVSRSILGVCYSDWALRSSPIAQFECSPLTASVGGGTWHLRGGHPLAHCSMNCVMYLGVDDCKERASRVLDVKSNFYEERHVG